MSDCVFFPERDDYLLQMEQVAKEAYIPIIKPEVGQLLRVLIKAKKPARILEIGTAIGYSTIWMARATDKDTEIVTIEIDEDMYEKAKENFSVLGLESKINQKYGDALEILGYLQRDFDFVFIDAAKGQYLNYLELVLNLLPQGGIIVADNVLYHGYVEKEETIARKRRTMVRTLQEYLNVVTEHPLLDSIILSLGDGIALSVKK